MKCKSKLGSLALLALDPSLDEGPDCISLGRHAVPIQAADHPVTLHLQIAALLPNEGMQVRAHGNHAGDGAPGWPRESGRSWVGQNFRGR